MAGEATQAPKAIAERAWDALSRARVLLFACADEPARTELLIAMDEARELVAELTQDPMPLERAQAIVEACCAHVWYREGLVEDEPPSLAGYTLAELLEAQRVVKAEDDRTADEPGPRTLHMVCDDRLVAALYVAHHYEPTEAPYRPVAIAGTAAVVVARMPESEVGDGR